MLPPIDGVSAAITTTVGTAHRNACGPPPNATVAAWGRIAWDNHWEAGGGWICNSSPMVVSAAVDMELGLDPLAREFNQAAAATRSPTAR